MSTSIDFHTPTLKNLNSNSGPGVAAVLKSTQNSFHKSSPTHLHSAYGAAIQVTGGGTPYKRFHNVEFNLKFGHTYVRNPDGTPMYLLFDISKHPDNEQTEESAYEILEEFYLQFCTYMRTPKAEGLRNLIEEQYKKSYGSSKSNVWLTPVGAEAHAV